ncbi:hypothetical protein GN244_ATG17908 [Phytophthora infestans]|uniref:Uncharacterized protein n=1 Tax=Phytophthora infestans TaxID=4787 RepID=A0A833SRN3_PHYIN|nr:hypothetical protein GN244_ATG17908 [Phytophthora infestans]KAF4139596.1 hypothetical protein GN958_ATG11081 [Phytophthora infestans]
MVRRIGSTTTTAESPVYSPTSLASPELAGPGVVSSVVPTVSQQLHLRGDQDYRRAQDDSRQQQRTSATYPVRHYQDYDRREPMPTSRMNSSHLKESHYGPPRGGNFDRGFSDDN